MVEERSGSRADELLVRVQAEEERRRRGALRIFLGYAAGTGKTYKMLQAAQERKAQGIDVVAGYIETHGRPETEALTEGLERLPRKQVTYRNVVLEEMDLEALLIRKPQLALVDELAHSNVPGSTHTKRFQDVQDLLSAGIDVYTTLNVQHIESLRDIVAQITGITVHEAVPDSLLDDADDIVLVDLTPDELLQRLREGKVYVPDQAEQAILKFFRKGNLTALRELAMRRAAEHVDDKVDEYMQTRSISGPWRTTERMLVIVGADALGERLVRAGRRQADELRADWLVAHVEPPDRDRMSVTRRARLERTLSLAEQLGATVVRIPGHSVVDTVLDYARQHNVTKLVVGSVARPRWRELLRPSTANSLVHNSGDVDVQIITGELVPEPEEPRARAVSTRRDLTGYLLGALIVLAATGAGELLRPYVAPFSVLMFYLLAVVTAAFFLGKAHSVFVSLLSVVAFNFFFVEPRFTFLVEDPEYLITFAGLIVVGLVISELLTRVRRQMAGSLLREQETADLFMLSRDISRALGLHAVVEAVLANGNRAFHAPVTLFMPDPERPGQYMIHGRSGGTLLSPSELAVVDWVFHHRESAGKGTETLKDVGGHYAPLQTAGGIWGVIGVPVPQGRDPMDFRRLMPAFAGQVALGIERAKLAEATRQTEVQESNERFQSALLASIAHDLRTPLVSIIGVLTSLDDPNLDEEARQRLIATSKDEADRLNRLVGNLLDMTRIEAGALRPQRMTSDVDELVGAALEQVRPLIAERQVNLNIPHDLPLLFVDPGLITQVLANLVENAAKYSRPTTAIDINAYVSSDGVEVTVADRGTGIAPAELPGIFDKALYAGSRHGVGLGLFICKGIIEAHGGRIWAENRPGGGAVVGVALPILKSAAR